jgi:hypothetical protein
MGSNPALVTTKRQLLGSPATLKPLAASISSTNECTLLVVNGPERAAKVPSNGWYLIGSGAISSTHPPRTTNGRQSEGIDFRMPAPPQICFILGAQKTATSTLTGILNCHPEILMLYETNLSQPWLSKRGRQLVSTFPYLRQHFHVTSDLRQNLLDMAQTLHSRYGHSYAIVGDKIITLDHLSISKTANCKYIFTTRDLRTWLAKDTIVDWYLTDVDAIPAAIDFTKFLIESFRYENGMRVSLEQLIANNDATIVRLSEFLTLDLKTTSDNWSEKIGFINDQVKLTQPWSKGHQSSNIFTGKLDTTTVLKPHPFWDACLPLFDKYFGHLTDATFSIDEIERDCAALEKLRSFAPLPLSALYEQISTGKERLPKIRKLGNAVIKSTLKLRRYF